MGTWDDWALDQRLRLDAPATATPADAATPSASIWDGLLDGPSGDATVAVSDPDAADLLNHDAHRGGRTRRRRIERICAERDAAVVERDADND